MAALGLFVFLAGPVLAADLKVAVVDLQQVLEKSEPGQKAISQLQEDFKGMKEELDEKKSKVDQLREQIQKQSLVLSQEAQIDKETEYKQKVRDFQSLYQSYQKKMKLKEQKLREPIIKELVEVIRDYGKENNYTLVMDKKNSGVIYNSDAIEVTSKIIVELNKAWRQKEKK
jgi:outer membrane protein